MHQATRVVPVPTSAVEQDDQGGHTSHPWEIPSVAGGLLREGDSELSAGGDRSEQERPICMGSSYSVLLPVMWSIRTCEVLMSEVIRNASAYEGEIPRSSLDVLIQEAIGVADEDFGVQAAVVWAAGYQFPHEMLDSDLQCLRCFRAAQFLSDGTRRFRGNFFSAQPCADGRHQR